MSLDIKIVSVDDNAINLLLIEMLTKELGYDVISFESPVEAYDYIKKSRVDIVLTDYMMPEMHGIAFITMVRKISPDIPIVMITAISDDNTLKLDAIKAGATEFLNKPLNPAEFKARLTNLVNLRMAQILLHNKALLLEKEVEKAVRLVETREKETLDVLGRASDYKDPETGMHINRVASYSAMMIQALGRGSNEQKLIYYSSPLHDIGKIGIPDHILTKPGRYTPEEFNVMKKHPIIGYEMLKDASSPYLRKGAEIALGHHEKFDGSGYPYGIKGMQIPLFGRIVAIADVFDALTSKRTYKDKWDIESAIDLLRNEKGSHFDPELVDVFLNNLDKVKQIFQSQNQADQDTVSYRFDFT